MKKIALKFFCIFSILTSCCMGGYKLGSANINIYFENYQNPYYSELYPRFSNSRFGRIPDYEKGFNSLKIDINNFDVNQKLDTVIYLIEFSGKVYDSFTNVKYKTYDKSKCEEGMSVSFNFRGKEYKESETHSIKIK
jgi:hypothetical protein